MPLTSFRLPPAPPFLRNLSYVGCAVGTLLFAASLTPSLLPRHYAVQGILSGFAFATGYGMGWLATQLWNYLELPHPRARVLRWLRWATMLTLIPLAVVFLWRATVWQNSIRELMEMEPLATAYPSRVTVISAAVAVVLILTARAVRWCWLAIHRRMAGLVPRRVSYVASTLIVVLLALLLTNDVAARLALSAADAVFLQIDKLAHDDLPPPVQSWASGGPGSLIPWESIGLQGKHFIAGGPTAAEIGQFWGAEAEPPLRIYAGLRSASSEEERAQLALQELIRVGGFERSCLIVATPTGTGWLDPGAVDTIEFLHRGDTAIVSMQYSYLPSWITILVDPPRSRESARALFDAVYEYWTALPRDQRPRLYLHGLSLGAYGSETSADLFTIFEDPIQGGLWSGPPFPSTAWQAATTARAPESPIWRPKFRDGSVVRFTGRESSLDAAGSRWSPMRFVYLQHASDPMIFFSPDLLYRRPEWLAEPRGPDVSPYLRWRPLVTFLQTAFDLPMATSVPVGYGHNYAATSYIDCWIAVTDPAPWDGEKTQRLKQYFAAKSP